MSSIPPSTFFVLTSTLIALVAAIAHDLLLNPYGINQRCREKRSFRLKTGKELKLVQGDETADLNVVSGHAQLFGHRVAESTFGLLLIEEFGLKLSSGYGILLRDASGIYEISIDCRGKDVHSRCRLSVLPEAPSSLEGYLVAIAC